MNSNPYQVGGSLKKDSPSYIERLADRELYQALKAGEFCFALNSRQMGKSSLLVRTRYRLQAEGTICTTLDMTCIGSENISALQWYKGIIVELVRSFKLFGKINLKKWWQAKDEEEISFLQRLNHFISDILLVEFPQDKIVIFIDEIDSILSLNFSVDDFFALIRFCYNQRAIDPEYNRITFAIFGVATPSDLIADKTRTPFNIGKEIKLQGFTEDEAKPLAKGLKIQEGDPLEILKEILSWTQGQPFLTQKICQLALNLSRESVSKILTIPRGSEAFWVDNIVKKAILKDWESQDKPEHLKTIRDRIICNTERAGRLLSIYQNILQGKKIEIDDSSEQRELVLSGLLVKNQNRLAIKNRIYSQVFNLVWVEKQLNSLRPYSQALEKWELSQKTDESRLLRGKTLRDARSWAKGKNLSNSDHQFLAASFELEQKEIQKNLKAEKSKAIEAKLIQEQKNTKLQKLLLTAVTLALAGTSIFGAIAYLQYQRAEIKQQNAIAREKEAKISQIELLISSALRSYESQQQLDALVQSIQAIKRLRKTLDRVDPTIRIKATQTLEKIIYKINEYNRLSGHTSEVNEVIWHEATQTIFSASSNGTIKQWQPNGKLIKNIVTNKSEIKTIAVSRNGDLIVSGSDDKLVKLWRSDGTLLQTFPGHKGKIYSVAIDSENDLIVSASSDRTVKIWHPSGRLLHNLTGHQKEVKAVVISSDGKLIVSGSADGILKYWQPDGTLIRAIADSREVSDLAIGNNGQIIVSASSDGKINIRNREGILINTLKDRNIAVRGVAISKDGKSIASTFSNNKIKIWTIDGKIVQNLVTSGNLRKGIAFSPDGKSLASTSFENTIQLWRINNDDRLLKTFYPHRENIRGIAWSPDGKYIASGSNDRTVKITNLDGMAIAIFRGHTGLVRDVAWSSDGNYIASGSEDGTVKLWKIDGTLVRTFTGKKLGFRKVEFSPDSQYLAAASEDNIVKLWQVNNGKLLTKSIGHRNRVFNVAFSPDGKYLASSSLDSTIKLWHLDGRLIRTYIGHSREVYGIAFSPDGKYLASASGDRTVKLWKIDGTLVRTHTDHQDSVRRVAFSPDGKYLASASEDKTVKLWQNGKLLKTLNRHYKGVRAIAWHPDGKILASAGRDDSIVLWNLENIFNLNELEYACNWVRNYLHTNADIQTSDRLRGSERRRYLCD